MTFARIVRVALALSLGASLAIARQAPPADKVEPEVYRELARSPGHQVHVVVLLNEFDEALRRVRSLRQAHSKSAQERVLRRLQATPFRTVYRYTNVPAFTGYADAQALARLAHDPDVVAVGLDARGRAALSNSVAFLRASNVHGLGITGAGATVAVIDSGIDTDHPDLVGDIAPGAFFFLGSGSSSGPGAEDANGHGTRVAGIVTSDGIVAPVGVAPDAQILPIRVLDAAGNGFLTDWASGVDYVVTHQDDYANLCAINMSLVSNDTFGSCPCGFAINNLLNQVIGAARLDGIPTFVASGNDGLCGAMTSPACTKHAVAVASVFGTATSQPPDSLVPASNTGACNELAAPGYNILSTRLGGITGFFTGTSAAAPHCAGVAALACEARTLASLPPLSADLLIRLMKRTGRPTTDTCTSGPLPVRIDALELVEAALGQLAPDRVR